MDNVVPIGRRHDRWYSHCANPESLLSLYPSQPPLDSLSLFEVNLDREGRAVRIRGELPTFPEVPPKRWHPDYNTAHVRIVFWSVRELEIRGWASTMEGRILVENSERGGLVRFESKFCEIRFCCDDFRIERVTGLITEGAD